MRNLLIVKEFLKGLMVALVLPIFLMVSATAITMLMYLALLDELYREFKFKTRKKVNDEH